MTRRDAMWQYEFDTDRSVVVQSQRLSPRLTRLPTHVHGQKPFNFGLRGKLVEGSDQYV